MLAKLKKHPIFVQIILSYLLALIGLECYLSTDYSVLGDLFNGSWLVWSMVALFLVMPVLMTLYHVYLVYQTLRKQEDVSRDTHYDVFTMVYSLVCMYHFLGFSIIAVFSEEGIFAGSLDQVWMRGLQATMLFFLLIFGVASFIVLLNREKRHSALTVVIGMSGLYMSLFLLTRASFFFYHALKGLMVFRIYSVLPSIVFAMIIFKQIMFVIRRYQTEQYEGSFWTGWKQCPMDARKWPVVAVGFFVAALFLLELSPIAIK